MPKQDELRERALAPYQNAQRIAFSPLTFQAARVARDNGLLKAVDDARADGIDPAAAAKKVGISRYAGRVLLEACLSLDLVTLEGGRYRITQSGRVLLTDPLVRTNMDFNHDVCYQGAYFLEQSLAQSRPVGLKVFGDWDTIYQGLAALPDKVRKSWFAFDHAYSDAVFPAVLPRVLSRNPKRLLDVGANTGKWALTCLRGAPTLSLTLLDHPGQLAVAQEQLRQAGVAERAECVPMDLLDHTRPFPGGQDAVWMSQFLDCFGEDDIVALLRRGRAALAPEGVLYVLETYWDRQPNPVAQASVIGTSLYFACMANGQSRMYHSEDLKQCLSEAGLEVIGDEQLLYHTLFVCRPK